MAHRGAGWVVLVLALLLMAVAPALNGRRTAGNAQRSAEPVVGDCVQAPLKPYWEGDTPQSRFDRPTAILEPCSGPSAARVLSRVPTITIPERPTLQQLMELNKPCNEAVTARIEQWQGGPFTYSDGTTFVQIRLQVLLGARLAAPDEAAIARGERWTVCHAFSWTTDGELMPTPLTGHRTTDHVGVCYTNPAGPRPPPLESPTVPCTEPHREQSIGSAVISSVPAAFDYSAICQEFLRQATGLDDITAGGRLKMVADQTLDNSSGGRCDLRVVDPDRRLSGSLIAIGDGPLPWG